jgi:hypothetical protein
MLHHGTLRSYELFRLNVWQGRKAWILPRRAWNSLKTDNIASPQLHFVYPWLVCVKILTFQGFLTFISVDLIWVHIIYLPTVSFWYTFRTCTIPCNLQAGTVCRFHLIYFLAGIWSHFAPELERRFLECCISLVFFLVHLQLPPIALLISSLCMCACRHQIWDCYSLMFHVVFPLLSGVVTISDIIGTEMSYYSREHDMHGSWW